MLRRVIQKDTENFCRHSVVKVNHVGESTQQRPYELLERKHMEEMSLNFVMLFFFLSLASMLTHGIYFWMRVSHNPQ